MLYWFRTPPGVRVGRAALDEDAIHLIEQLNPGVEFDWPRIMKGQGAPPTETRPPVDARRSRPDNRRQQSSQGQAPARSGPPPGSSGQPAAPRAPERPSPAAESATPVEIRSAPPAELVEEVVLPTHEIPAHAKIGADGVQRLRARYAEILVRISERAVEESRREELKVLAGRLNPDSWVTDDDVVQGLEQYESVFASLREVVGQKRRRRRRGSRPQKPEGGIAAESGEGAPASSGEGLNSGDSVDSDAGDEGSSADEF